MKIQRMINYIKILIREILYPDTGVSFYSLSKILNNIKLNKDNGDDDTTEEFIENKTFDELSALKKLLDHSFRVELNMNDVFFYATADSGWISNDDIMDILPYYTKYGFDALVAYESINRDEDPKIEEYNSENYKEVKNKLIELMEANSDFLVDLNFEYRKRKKEIAEFGSKLVFEGLIKNEIKEGREVVLYEFKCYPINNKEKYGIGRCQFDAIEDLRNKIKKV